MDDKIMFGISLTVGIAIGTVLTIIVFMQCIDEMEWQRDIVKHQGAYYNSQTGGFTWKGAE